MSGVRLARALVAVLSAAACARPAASGSPQVRVVGDSVVEVRGVNSAVARALARRGSDVFRVVVEAEMDSASQQPVLGGYEVVNGRLTFRPRFPLAPGVPYKVEVDLPEGMSLVHRFTAGRVDAGRPTRVVAVHPTDAVLPSNVLRFTIEFSAPMAGEPVIEHVGVLDDTGMPVPAVFLEMNEDLWDAERRSVTLLVDPGRIKRGIRSNLEMGAPFEAGRRYSLVIKPTLRDAAGAPLAAGYRRDIRIGGFDALSPDPSGWKVSSPRAGTRDTLRVEFGEPLDRALALRMLNVVDLTGASVPGRPALESYDRVWTFRPASPWPESDLRLRVDPELEDLAGNSVGRAFDSDRLTGARADGTYGAGGARLLRVPVIGNR